MADAVLPHGLVEARRTPRFDHTTLPASLAASHRTAVWAEVRVESGSVRFTELEGDAPRDVRLEPGESAVIVPGVEHQVEPSTDAIFYIQFFREPDPSVGRDTVGGGQSGGPIVSSRADALRPR